ncbi:hypothetical protein MNEG_15413 [Monoraphidium neglectum]|uniref:Nucleoporin Nup133/Nup155-like C-terminal domain-containing protein n=1 Tax=Monoraphidium neglectum TaxID=145388 RepID=A0A0D2MB44_9CHLO|nr:hypothetical protein MNEG_15413 [Monoraphidium neglectum]KIY92550.1 hypothetical protein MNEG_15413 [Monoraphidium neglectum]|eukprot:XP_013891570.1 hypothetical protein MNEG_15413 [Monoraphidium neglectum]
MHAFVHVCASAAKSGAQSPIDWSAAQRQLLRDFAVAVTRSPDAYAASRLFSTLADAGADDDLLGLDAASPHLEGYLRQEGGLAGMSAGGQVGPLTPRQVRHVELLARLHVARGRYSAAAQAYRALAERRGGRGGEAVPLPSRLEAFQSALLQARSVGDDGLVEGLRASCRVMEIQITTHARMGRLLAAATRGAQRNGGGGGGGGGAAEAPEARERASALRSSLSELESSCLDISDLYNTHAQPHGMWDVCLEICHFAGHVPAEYVRQLWDLLLKAAWDCTLGPPGADGAGPSAADFDAGCIAAGFAAQAGGGAAGAGSAAAALEVACEQVRLGVGLWPRRGWALQGRG